MLRLHTLSSASSSKRFGLAAALLFGATVACGPRTAGEAESRKDVAWLADHPTGDSIAALGRLADAEPRALAALESRAANDVNVYIAAWSAVTRGAAWGTTLLKAALADPTRAEMASSVLPRRDARLVPLLADLEAAVTRLAAGKRGIVIGGILASIGPVARPAVERRLLDAKTRGLMCDGIALPEASSDAKAALLAVPPEARDNPSCVNVVMEMAANDDAVLDWLAVTAEPGLLGVAAKSTLPCPRLGSMWKKALVERRPETQSAMTVPLQRSISRCPSALDPVLGELLAKAPRARPTVIHAIDPYGSELAGLKETCAGLKKGYARGENAMTRERAEDALLRGCPR